MKVLRKREVVCDKLQEIEDDGKRDSLALYYGTLETINLITILSRYYMHVISLQLYQPFICDIFSRNDILVTSSFLVPITLMIIYPLQNSHLYFSLVMLQCTIMDISSKVSKWNHYPQHKSVTYQVYLTLACNFSKFPISLNS